MAQNIPIVVADVELQISTAIGVGDTTFSLASANDDDGNALPAGKYCFTLDNGKSNKEYLIGQLNGTDITSVVSVSRQGVESSGAAQKHRVGASCIITDFATIQRVADALRGADSLDGANPMVYDAEPSLSDRKEIATVGYVLDNITGGTVAFDTQTVAGNAGEAVADGDLVYFKTSDQEWYLTDADTAATVEGVQLGIALGTGSDGAAITGGILVNGLYTTTGLTAGSEYYASNTAGEYTTSAGTTSRKIGIALSTTKLFLYPSNPQTVTSNEKAALAGGGDFGTPSTSNKFLTEDYASANSVDVQEFTSSGTWTKPASGKRVFVQLWGAGGSGGVATSGDYGGGGGGGGYIEKMFDIDELGTTEAVTIGAGGAAVAANQNTLGNAGGLSTFGSLLTAYGGGGGLGSTTSGDVAGGGGAGPFGNGGTATTATAGAAGSPGTPLGGTGGVSLTTGTDALFGGGGGSRANAGRKGYYGGGGGGGIGGGSTTIAGGISMLAGNGGAGKEDESAVAGSQPGGGGGACASSNSSHTSGAGGDGKCIVTPF